MDSLCILSFIIFMNASVVGYLLVSVVALCFNIDNVFLSFFMSFVLLVGFFVQSTVNFLIQFLHCSHLELSIEVLFHFIFQASVKSLINLGSSNNALGKYHWAFVG